MRLTTTMRYLHPQVIGTTYTWTKEQDRVKSVLTAPRHSSIGHVSA